jgi:hypothetical protein
MQTAEVSTSGPACSNTYVSGWATSVNDSISNPDKFKGL